MAAPEGFSPSQGRFTRIAPWLMCLFLAACGGGSGSSGASGPGTSSPPPTGGGDAEDPPAATVQAEQSHFDVAAVAGETAPSRSTLLTLENGPEDGVYLYYDFTDNALVDVIFSVESSSTARVEMLFRAPAALTAGTYDDSIVLEICLDESCTQPVKGSPLTLSTSYAVSAATGDISPPEPEPAPEWPLLEPLRRIELTHDVIDAEYSAALDAIVMVGLRPSSALHVYLLDSDERMEITLQRSPTSVALSPDGRFAAIGHDAMITHVDLTTLTAADPDVTLLDVSARVGDLVLDRRGVVHVVPAVDQWEQVHSVDVATNEERLGSQLYAGGVTAMHPTEDAFYVATRGLSPAKIEKHLIEGGLAATLRRSPYHSDHQACGNVWMSQSGETIYTACGNTFRSSTEVEQDMIYTGQIELSFERGRIESLSHSAAGREVLFIEADRAQLGCIHLNDPASCLRRITVVNSEFLNLLERYDLPLVNIGEGQEFSQRPLFVFQGADGHGRYMISRLLEVPAETHFLSILP